LAYVGSLRDESLHRGEDSSDIRAGDGVEELDESFLVAHAEQCLDIRLADRVPEAR
jgi:hypothetical protein